MACLQKLSNENPIIYYKPITNNNHQELKKNEAFFPITRRAAAVVLMISSVTPDSLARERRNRKTVPLEYYQTTFDGLKYYDLVEGKGPIAEKGSTVQPYEFKVGAPPGRERKHDFVDNPNGLFSAQAASKPPPAMYYVVEGMKVGGKRTMIVLPELGYGKKGIN